MKKYIVILAFILFHNQLLAQPDMDAAYPFEPLKIHARTSSQKTINAIKQKDIIRNSPFFFTESYGKEKGLFLFEKTAKDWIVYDYNYFVSNYSIGKPKVHCKRYVSIDVGAMRSGMGENHYGWIVLFDLKKRTSLYFQTYSYNSGTYDSGGTFVNECISTVKYINGSLKVFRKCKKNTDDKYYCQNCIKTGTYKIIEDKLEIPAR